MAAGALQKAAKIAGRKLPDQISEQDVFVRDLTNDDLGAVDELTDEYAELETQRAELLKQVEDAETADDRRDLRAQARALAKEGRSMNTRMLGLYIESKDGQPFEQQVLDALPVRVQTSLIRAATEILFPEDRPTPAGTNATG